MKETSSQSNAVPITITAALPGTQDPRRQLEIVASNATLALFIMDERQECTYMNPAAEQLTGFALHELRGKPLHDYLHHTRPDGSPYPLEECPIDRAFPRNMREQGEEVFVHRNGGFYRVAFTASPIREGDRTVGTIIEVRDISEERRKQDEMVRLLEELHLERARMRQVLEGAPAFMAILSGEDHVFEMANRNFEQLVGERELIGRRAAEALPDAGGQGYREILQQVYRTGKAFEGTEMPLSIRRTPNAPLESRYLNLVCQPLKEAGGRTSGVLLHGVDVTEQVRARHLVEEQAAEVELINETLENQSIRLEETARAAEQAEQDLRQILEGIREPVVVYDAAWRFRYMNSSAVQAMGIERADAEDGTLREPIWEMYPQIAGTAFEREMKRAATERRYVTFEEYSPTSGNWSEVGCHPMPDGGLAVIWRDISARKRGEESLHYLAEVSRILSESLDLDLTLKSLADAVVPHLADWCTITIRGPDGEIRQVALSHVDPGKVKWARELNERYPPDPNAPGGAHEVIRTGQPVLIAEISDEMMAAAAQDEDHLRILRELGLRSAMVVPLGAREHTLGALTLVSAESGRRYGQPDVDLALEIATRAALAVDNATLFHESELARLKLEEQTRFLEEQAEEMQAQAVQMRELQLELEMGNEDLRILNESLAEASAAAKEANEAKSEFLSTMSHELRTPLNAIIGYSELLLIGVPSPIDPLAQAQVDRVARAARHLLSLIEEILTYTRVEAGREEIEFSSVELDDLVDEVCGIVEPLAAAKGLEFRRPLAGPIGSIETDPRKLRQILINLLANAVKFTDRGDIDFKVERGAADYCFIISDTGVGIAPEDFDAIFEPFRQVERSRTRQAEGSGLGLTVSRRLARMLGGDVTLDSERGQGSRFVLCLPVSADWRGAPESRTSEE